MTRLLRKAQSHHNRFVRWLGSFFQLIADIVLQPLKAIYGVLVVVAKGIETLTEVYGLFQRASLILAGWMVWVVFTEWRDAPPQVQFTAGSAAVLGAVATLFTAVVALYQWRRLDVETMWSKATGKPILPSSQLFGPVKARKPDPTDNEGD